MAYAVDPTLYIWWFCLIPAFYESEPLGISTPNHSGQRAPGAHDAQSTRLGNDVIQVFGT